MNLEVLATTFDFLGKILIVVMALLVHRKVRRQKTINKRVLKEMRLEEVIGIVAVILIVAGYILHLYSFGVISPS